MKYLKYTLGILLVVIAGIYTITALRQMKRSWYADFPCGSDGYDPLASMVEPGVRIAYCIDYKGRYVISGAGIYAEGISTQDRLTITSKYEEGFEPVILSREDEILYVNNRALRKSQSYSDWNWYPSSNPMLLFANHLTIRNDGVDDSNNVLFATGEVKEGWLPNPIGLSILVVGIVLIWSAGKKGRRIENWS